METPVPAPFDFLAGPAGRFGARLVPPASAPDAIPAAALVAEGGLDLALGTLRSRHPDGESRALLSLWSRHYFYSLIPPVVLGALLAGRTLPLGLSGTAVHLNGDGVPAAIVLPHAGTEGAPVAATDMLRPLARDHLEPLIDGLAAQAAVSPRVLWGNAAGYLHWVVELLAGEDPASPALAEAHALIHAGAWPDGWPNALDEPMRYTDGPDGRQAWRKVCCLLYRVPGRDLCPYCPLALRASRREH
ncbi:siderophore-iron reductase FhuF [Skermanella mucosa]|uniref:siderophore-iron reductase FhuF n=1 Tax=Skermanella mucosa TaxID=1789672 RepID=UPI00192AF058|nr:siderophore-iron reductase FhuF [Skermanella mucosa]UEM19668.1 siderophore-iron reductase FhuF [Skermanella mucosa]